MNKIVTWVKCQIRYLTSCCIGHGAPCSSAAMLVLVLSLPNAWTENAVKAETFVDSVGFNIHLHYTDTAYYSSFPKVRDALLELHVRHVRDGLVTAPISAYVDRFNELGKLGIKTVFITKPEQTPAILSAFPAKVGRTFEGYEAPNELDISGDPHWSDTLRHYLPILYTVAKASGYGAIGPSLVKEPSYAQLGNIQSFASAGNLHNYPGGRNPGTSGWGADGYGSMAWNLNHVRRTAGTLPVITTETGYNNDPKFENYVPEVVAAKYLPRLLLYQFSSGIRRTYLYELLSSGHEDYGLMSAACVPKPAFASVRSLLALLDDHDTRPDAGHLDYRLSSVGPEIRHLLLQKSDGRFFLALWLESSSYDVPSRQARSQPTQGAQLALPWRPRAVVLHRWTESGIAEKQVLAGTQSISLQVSDFLTVVEIVPPAVERVSHNPDRER